MTDINPETGNTYEEDNDIVGNPRGNWYHDDDDPCHQPESKVKPFPDVKNYTDGLRAIINSGGANTGYYPDPDEDTEPPDDAPWNVIQNVQFVDPMKALRRRARNYLILVLLYSLLQMVGTAWLVHVM